MARISCVENRSSLSIKQQIIAFIDDNKVQTVYAARHGEKPELTPEGIFTVKVKAVNPYFRKKNIPGGDPRNHLDRGGLALMH